MANFNPSADEVWRYVTKEIEAGSNEHNVFKRIVDGLTRALNERTSEAESLTMELRIANTRLERAQIALKEAKGWGYVYLMKGDEYYKIGMSINPPQRAFDISPKMPFEVKLVHVIETDNARKLEMELHQRFEGTHLRGEWFNLTPNDIEYIKELTGEQNNGKQARSQ